MRNRLLPALALAAAVLPVADGLTGPVTPSGNTDPVAIIIDADTIKIGGERIRLVDIDAPESFRSRCEAELVLALAAKERLRELLTAARSGSSAKAAAASGVPWRKSTSGVSTSGRHFSPRATPCPIGRAAPPSSPASRNGAGRMPCSATAGDDEAADFGSPQKPIFRPLSASTPHARGPAGVWSSETSNARFRPLPARQHSG